MDQIAAKLRKYPKCSAGVVTTCGLLLYQRKQIRQYISQCFWNDESEKKTDRRPDYIYIKYHIYRESMRKLKQKQEDEKKWISVITHPIGKWWKALKHSVAWRLLKIAQNGSQYERLLAIRQLAGIDHLKDWDFRHLAQICDARTAVSLARSGADTRWFCPSHMHGLLKNPKIILAEMHDMLSKLRPNSCVDHFFSKYFPEQDTSHDIVDEFFTQDKPFKASTEDTVMLKEIVAFLHHITKETAVAEKIVKTGGLVQLMELCKIFKDDNETLSTLCKALANISLVEDSVHHFFVSGWIHMLAKWQICPDLRLQVIAAKTMANLDLDDPNRSVYPPNVYPLYPRLRTLRKPKADIIFIHGLLGGVFITWRQRDRTPSELGLYGKNAFYTNETDDVFLVGEQNRLKPSNYETEKKKPLPKIEEQLNIGEDSLLKASEKSEEKPLDISDAATKELVETLRSEGELGSDWEVLYPDIPVAGNAKSRGEFSVPGNEWQNEDRHKDYTNCWPMEWLPDDYPGARIIGIDYTSAVTEWASNFAKYCPCERGQGKLDTRASSLLERISQSDIGNQRPVIWIGHSMGGILTKLILLKAAADNDAQKQQLVNSTKGIVFLGTPHRGSPIAKWKQHMQLILSPSIEVKEMEEGAPMLINMHDRFMELLETTLSQTKIVSIAEGQPTMLTTFKFPLQIVTEQSANINFGDFFILKDDHLSLSKPMFRQSFLYKRMLTVIGQSIKIYNSKRDKSQSHEEQQQTKSEVNQKMLTQKTPRISINSSLQPNKNIKPATSTASTNNNLEQGTKGILALLSQLNLKFLT